MSLSTLPSCLIVLRGTVGKFFGCWKIFFVHFDRRGVWDIHRHHFCLPMGDFLLYVLMSV